MLAAITSPRKAARKKNTMNRQKAAGKGIDTRLSAVPAIFTVASTLGLNVSAASVPCVLANVIDWDSISLGICTALAFFKASTSGYNWLMVALMFERVSVMAAISLLNAATVLACSGSG